MLTTLYAVKVASPGSVVRKTTYRVRLMLTSRYKAIGDGTRNLRLTDEENKTISLASDVFVGNAELENFVRPKLHKMRADNTGGLPNELILVFNRPYMKTNSIDVAEGL
ncbi:hypothetical protein TNCV_3781591 [Trichonephila clavipes]|nr:hypothetical protein TNCV_3781591 [Trichonephila clavipes]